MLNPRRVATHGGQLTRINPACGGVEAWRTGAAARDLTPETSARRLHLWTDSRAWREFSAYYEILECGGKPRCVRTTSEPADIKCWGPSEAGGARTKEAAGRHTALNLCWLLDVSSFQFAALCRPTDTPPFMPSPPRRCGSVPAPAPWPPVHARHPRDKRA